MVLIFKNGTGKLLTLEFIFRIVKVIITKILSLQEMLLLYYTMNQSHTDVTMVSSSLLGRLGLVVSGAGVSVVESLALVLSVLAWQPCLSVYSFQEPLMTAPVAAFHIP